MGSNDCIVISKEKLVDICYSARPVILEARKAAYALCRQGVDLPGLWPHFYLYPDLSWTVGYPSIFVDPNKICIATLMVEDFSHMGLMSSIEINLLHGYMIQENKKDPALDHDHNEIVEESSPVKSRAKLSKPKGKRGRKKKNG